MIQLYTNIRLSFYMADSWNCVHLHFINYYYLVFIIIIYHTILWAFGKHWNFGTAISLIVLKGQVITYCVYQLKILWAIVFYQYADYLVWCFAIIFLSSWIIWHWWSWTQFVHFWQRLLTIFSSSGTMYPMVQLCGHHKINGMWCVMCI